jgi:hypothetical protein
MFVEDLIIDGPIGENKDYKFSCKVKLVNQTEMVFQNESILNIWKNMKEEEQNILIQSFILSIIDAKLRQQ